MPRSMPDRNEKPNKAMAITPRVGSQGKTKKDQIVIAIRPRLLTNVTEIDKITIILAAPDVTVSSARPTPALITNKNTLVVAQI